MIIISEHWGSIPDFLDEKDPRPVRDDTVMLWGPARDDTIMLWGFIPSLLDENDPRPAREQFNRYKRGDGYGGWFNILGATFDRAKLVLTLPSEKPMGAISALRFRDELLFLFDHNWVCIVQQSGSFEVAKMD